MGSECNSRIIFNLFTTPVRIPSIYFGGGRRCTGYVPGNTTVAANSAFRLPLPARNKHRIFARCLQTVRKQGCKLSATIPCRYFSCVTFKVPAFAVCYKLRPNDKLILVSAQKHNNTYGPWIILFCSYFVVLGFFLFCSCFVVIVLLCIFIFVSTSVVLPPSGSPIAVSSSSSSSVNNNNNNNNNNNTRWRRDRP
jgi:hypothetical protein